MKKHINKAVALKENELAENLRAWATNLLRIKPPAVLYLSVKIVVNKVVPTRPAQRDKLILSEDDWSRIMAVRWCGGAKKLLLKLRASHYSSLTSMSQRAHINRKLKSHGLSYHIVALEHAVHISLQRFRMVKIS